MERTGLDGAPSRRRDKDQTMRAILDAGLAVLAERGFQLFGVNEVARQAGCDKQLIYRYFDGLGGLVDAMAERLAGDLTAALSARAPSAPFSDYGALVEHQVLAVADLTRETALLARIAAWELAEPSDLAVRLVDTRGRRLAAWAADLRGGLSPPAGVDAPALNALLIGAAQTAAAASLTQGRLAGLTLADDAGWARVRAGLSALVRGVYGAPARA